MSFCLVLLMMLSSSIGAITVDKHGPDVPESSLNLVQENLDIVQNFQDGVYDFWFTYGPDKEFGGFHGRINQFGEPDPSSTKNCIMQTRHLYVASRLYLTGRYPQEHEEQLVQLMNDQYDWVVKHFGTNNGELLYKVSRDGETVIDGDQRMYYTTFSMLGFAWYSMAVKELDPERSLEAQLKAIENFQALYNRLYDSKNGGYDQAREGNFFFEYGQAVGEFWSSARKGANSHMHMLEALTWLCKASQDDFICDMLKELHANFMDDILGDFPYQRIVFLLNWTALSNEDSEYGHDLQIAHGIGDSGEVTNFTTHSKADVDAKALEIGKYVAFYGFDRTNGGVFFQGKNLLGPIDYTKAFWVQVESALGFWRAYLVSGDIDFLEKMKATLIWYRDFHLAEQVGEFYWEYNIYGADVRGPDLYETWKAAYHNMKCFLNMIEEMEAYLG